MQTLLHDSRINKFGYLLDGATKPQYPFIPLRTKNGVFAACSDRYPMGNIAVRQFGIAYPEGKIADCAEKKITELAKVENNLQNFTLVSPFLESFRVQPFAHQKQAIELMLNAPRLALLFEQGLGKTYIAIMTIHCLKAMGLPHKSLIITPGIVFESWQREIVKFSDLKCLPYRGDPAQRFEQAKWFQNSDWDICLTTFEMLTDRKERSLFFYEKLAEELGAAVNPRELKARPVSDFSAATYASVVKSTSNREFFKGLPYSNLIVDEASRCIDHKSNRSCAVNEYAQKAERVYRLSGTLCVGRPLDMFMPMTILSPDILGMSYTAFWNRYVVPGRFNRHIPSGYKNIDNLKIRISPHISSRTRSECIDLPERIFQKRYYSLPDKLKNLYNRIAKNDKISVQGVDFSCAEIVQKIQKCSQLLSGFLYYMPEDSQCDKCENLIRCLAENIQPASRECIHPAARKVEREEIELGANPKLDLLAEDLEECASEKLIIWAWYKYDLRRIAELLAAQKISFIRADEKDAPYKFENSNIRVFLGQTMQGIGITLNSATCMIYYSHGVALEPRLQSMDRNYRLGQTKSVVVKDYICAGSIEEKIVGLLSHKKDVCDFMQGETSCLCCELCGECGVNLFEKGCIYSEQLKRSEKIKKLSLGEIG